jgi:hypothetical protein
MILLRSPHAARAVAPVRIDVLGAAISERAT